MKNSLDDYGKTNLVVKFMSYLLDNLALDELEELPKDHNGFIDINLLMVENHNLYQDFLEEQVKVLIRS